MKLRWRELALFALVLACATGTLVAAGLAEDAASQPLAAASLGGTAGR